MIDNSSNEITQEGWDSENETWEEYKLRRKESIEATTTTLSSLSVSNSGINDDHALNVGMQQLHRIRQESYLYRTGCMRLSKQLGFTGFTMNELLFKSNNPGIVIIPSAISNEPTIFSLNKKFNKVIMSGTGCFF